MVDLVGVCLVDGVGCPKVLMIEKKAISPNVIPFPHPQRGKGEAQVIVKFVRSNNEYDSWGRQVYRMIGSGDPPIRYHYFIAKDKA